MSKKLWMLVAYNTENSADVRFRVYTRSWFRMSVFEKIPKIQFSDSGHGVVFVAREVPDRTYPEIKGINSCRDHVRQHAPRDCNGKKLEW